MIIEGNKIIIPVEIAFEDEQKIDQMMDKVGELKQGLSEVGVEQQEKEPGLPPSESQKESEPTAEGEIIAEGNLKDFDEEKGIGLSDVNKGLRTATTAVNPEAMLLNRLITLAPEIMPILLAYGLTETVVERLFAPGGPLDVRFKPYFEKMILGLMSFEKQQSLRIGTTTIITTASGGFRNTQGGAFVGSNLKDVKNFGVARIGLQEKINGWRPS